MRAPFWAVCCAYALLAGSVFAADESNGSQNLGPTAAPLGRPVTESTNSFTADPANNRLPASFAAENNSAAAINTLRYPQIVSMPSSTTAPAAAATTTTAAPGLSTLTVPSANATPAPFTSPAGVSQPWKRNTPKKKHAASSSRRFFSNPFKSAQLSKSKDAATPVAGAPVAGTLPAAAPPAAKPAVAPVAAAPVAAPTVAAQNVDPTDVIGTTGPGAKDVQVSPWRPMQTAFRQITGPNPTAAPQPPVNAVIAPNNPPPYSPPGRIPPQFSQAYPPSNSSNSSLADLSQPTPADPVYANGDSVRQRQIDAYEAQYGHPGGGGGCGCGCGSPGDSQICPNCGGWHHGTCLTNNPEGSCVLQRFGCCLTKPYPDCSNGCVDFCHSWIFHDDDCWLTSNHKCPAPGCGPYPYGSCPMDGQGKGNGCGCGNCGPCIRPNPVYFSAEGFVLTRDNQTINQVVANDGGAPILTTSDFGNFNWQAGPSFILGYKPTAMDAWELSYFGLQDWNETQQRGEAGGGSISLPEPLGTGVGLGFNAIDVLSVTYSSEINDAELNYFWHPGAKWLNWMVGFRYFRLDEQFDINALDSNPTVLNTYYTQSVNDLYGGQLGARAHFKSTNCSFDVTGKAGAFGNNVQMTQEIGPLGTPTIRNTDVSQTNWAFVGQVGCQFTYNFAWHWYAVGGYDLLWVNGVALAPDQLDFTLDPQTSGKNIDHTGTVFMHGAHVGLGFQW